MVSIAALSAYGVWCRPLTAWHPLDISGSGVGTDLGSGDISGSGVGTDLGSGDISGSGVGSHIYIPKHMRVYHYEVFGVLAEGRGMGWKPLLVPYWVVVGSWSWGPGGGPGVVHYCEMRSIFLWVSSLRFLGLACALSSCVWVFSWVSSLRAERLAGLCRVPFSPSGGLRGALSLSGSGVGSPGAPWPGTLSGFALNTRARETCTERPFWAISGPFRGGNTR